jgi:hypothetical protein
MIIATANNNNNVLVAILALLILPLLLRNYKKVKSVIRQRVKLSADSLMQIQGWKSIGRSCKETVENYLLHFPDFSAFPLSNGII